MCSSQIIYFDVYIFTLPTIYSRACENLIEHRAWRVIKYDTIYEWLTLISVVCNITNLFCDIANSDVSIDFKL